MPKGLPKGESLPLEDRLFAKIDIPSNPTECWMWTAGTHAFGHGKINGGKEHDKRALRAHRVVYELLVGPIPDGLDVLHSCDVPACCNPLHLRTGTDEDNKQDMRDRNRFSSILQPTCRKGASDGGGQCKGSQARCPEALSSLSDLHERQGGSIPPAEARGDCSMIGKLILPDASGHSAVVYDTEQPQTLIDAKELFDGILAKGGAAFNTETKERIKTWDPTAAEVVVLQPLQGG